MISWSMIALIPLKILEAYSKEKKASCLQLVKKEDAHKYGIIEPGENGNKALR